MEFTIGLIFFWLGAILGSFSGAVAWRLRKKKDFVRGRSECEHCHHILAPLDLVPIFSWIFLRGRCRYCKKAIGWSVLLAELLLGLAFSLSYFAWPFGLEGWLSGILFGIWLAVLAMLAILAIYDLRWTLLPDKLVFPLIALAVLFFIGRMVLSSVAPIDWPLEALYALMPITGIYGILYLASRGKWIGFGDVKLGIALGLLLGWQQALLALVLANFIGFLFVLPGLLSRKLDRSSQIPFGPFLIAGTILAFLYGRVIIDAYINFLFS